MRDFLQEALELKKDLLSPYNNGREIIRSTITSALKKASASRGNKNALTTLEYWTDSIVDDDYCEFDAGNDAPAGWSCAEWNGEAITEVNY